MKETPSKHIFSKHDNRHAFPGSATYFESGLGRRRIEGSLPNTHNLIDWIPLKEQLQRERPLVSSYQSDFRSRDKVPQVLVCHTNLQGQPLQHTPSTTYQRTYRSYYLREPSLSIFKQQEAAKESKLEEPEATAPTSNETTAPTSNETTAPTSNETTAPTSSESTAMDVSTTAEALTPGPSYGRPVPHKPRLTVSDCLRWHNC